MTRTATTVLKLFVAFAAIGGIVALVARDLSPTTHPVIAFAVGVGGAMAVLALAVAVMGLKFLVNREVLNAGGTDTQWLWFKADPPGLRTLQGNPPDGAPGGKG